MEKELQCPVCHQLFQDPVILPCSHNLCFKCAEEVVLKKCKKQRPTSHVLIPNQQIPMEIDKVSLKSEAIFSDSDSGYSGGSSGRAMNNLGDNEQHVSPVIVSTVSNLVSKFQSEVRETAPLSGSISTSYGVDMPALPETVSCLTCPVCHRTLFMDERGVAGLPRHTLMNKIVENFGKLSNSDQISHKPGFKIKLQTTQATPVTTQLNLETTLRCQLCDNHTAGPAVVRCVQCEVLYCTSCKDQCHPARGPLAKHILVSVASFVTTKSNNIDNGKHNKQSFKKYPPLPIKPKPKNYLKFSSCSQHPVEKNSLHCSTCCVSLCVQCRQDGRHKNHDVKPIGALYKELKSSLSNQMNSLSNKARQAKDLVLLLREMQDNIDRSCAELERKIETECNRLREAVERKRNEFIQTVAREKEIKSKAVRDQLELSTSKLKQTTGLLEYCIEVMKDNDVTAFLQIIQSLSERVSCSENQWDSTTLHPQQQNGLNFSLDCSEVAVAIETLDFLQNEAPIKPILRLAEGGVKRNTVTLLWSIPDHSKVDGFMLEMDNGNNGPFREIYRGVEHLCTIDGLHFNSLYRAKARAFNKSGSSAYSDVLQLQAPKPEVDKRNSAHMESHMESHMETHMESNTNSHVEAVHFRFDPKKSHDDIKLSNNNTSVTSDSSDDVTTLGSIGFFKGIFYWEFSIDRWDPRSHLEFGVASAGVDKGVMLSKDPYGWGMHVDESRSWIFHNNKQLASDKIEGGMSVGSRVGVLLDLTEMKVIFYVNGTQQGISLVLRPSDNNELRVLYPAITINRNVQVSLHPGRQCALPKNSTLIDPEKEQNIKCADADNKIASSRSNFQLPPKSKPSWLFSSFKKRNCSGKK